MQTQRPNNSLPAQFEGWVYRKFVCFPDSSTHQKDLTESSLVDSRRVRPSRLKWARRHLRWNPVEESLSMHQSDDQSAPSVWIIRSSQLESIRRTRDTVLGDTQSYNLNRTVDDPEEPSAVEKFHVFLKDVKAQLRFSRVESTIAVLRIRDKHGEGFDELYLATESEVELEDWIALLGRMLNLRWYEAMKNCRIGNNTAGKGGTKNAAVGTSDYTVADRTSSLVSTSKVVGYYEDLPSSKRPVDIQKSGSLASIQSVEENDLDPPSNLRGVFSEFDLDGAEDSNSTAAAALPLPIPPFRPRAGSNPLLNQQALPSKTATLRTDDDEEARAPSWKRSNSLSMLTTASFKIPPPLTPSRQPINVHVGSSSTRHPSMFTEKYQLSEAPSSLYTRESINSEQAVPVRDSNASRTSSNRHRRLSAEHDEHVLERMATKLRTLSRDFDQNYGRTPAAAVLGNRNSFARLNSLNVQADIFVSISDLQNRIDDTLDLWQPVRNDSNRDALLDSIQEVLSLATNVKQETHHYLNDMMPKSIATNPRLSKNSGFIKPLIQQASSDLKNEVGRLSVLVRDVSRKAINSTTADDVILALGDLQHAVDEIRSVCRWMYAEELSP